MFGKTLGILPVYRNSFTSRRVGPKLTKSVLLGYKHRIKRALQLESSTSVESHPVFGMVCHWLSPLLRFDSCCVMEGIVGSQFSWGGGIV